MSDNEIVDHLQELGLTEYQSRAYLAAVKLGRATPTDLADESGVPQARIYDVIDDLTDHGLIEVHSKSRGKEVTAPSPQTVLNQFKRRQIDDLSQRISTAVSSLEQVYHQAEENPEAYVTMVSREESALRHVRQAIDAAEREVTVSIEGHLYPEVRDELFDAVDRNVTARLLLNEDDPDLDRYEFPEDLRVRYRRTADTLIAADRTYGVFSSKHPAQTGQPYIITQERNLVLLFQNFSEQIWSASAVVQTGDGFPRRYLDPWRAIIDLGPELDDGAEFHATAWGTNTTTHRESTWEGRIVDYELAGPVDADYTVSVPVEASLTLATDDGEVTVGGWKATLEDVAAEGLEISPV